MLEKVFIIDVWQCRKYTPSVTIFRTLVTQEILRRLLSLPTI